MSVSNQLGDYVYFYKLIYNGKKEEICDLLTRSFNGAVRNDFVYINDKDLINLSGSNRHFVFYQGLHSQNIKIDFQYDVILNDEFTIHEDITTFSFYITEITRNRSLLFISTPVTTDLESKIETGRLVTIPFDVFFKLLEKQVNRWIYSCNNYHEKKIVIIDKSKFTEIEIIEKIKTDLIGFLLKEDDLQEKDVDPNLRTRLRFEVFFKLKEENPNWTQEKMALESRKLLDEDITAETVRNTYRLMGEKWKRGDRTR